MWKIFLVEGETTTPLAANINVVGGIGCGHGLAETNENNKPHYRLDKRHPITLVLEQPMGKDDTLYKLFKKIGGFRLKLTFEVTVADANGQAMTKDVLDVNLSELVPSLFRLDGNNTLVVQTLTAAEIVYL